MAQVDNKQETKIQKYEQVPAAATRNGSGSELSTMDSGSHSRAAGATSSSPASFSSENQERSVVNGGQQHRQQYHSSSTRRASGASLVTYKISENGLVMATSTSANDNNNNNSNFNPNQQQLMSTAFVHPPVIVVEPHNDDSMRCDCRNCQFLSNWCCTPCILLIVLAILITWLFLRGGGGGEPDHDHHHGDTNATTAITTTKNPYKTTGGQIDDYYDKFHDEFEPNQGIL